MPYVLTDKEYEQFRQMLRERARQREPGIIFRPGIGKTSSQPVRYRQPPPPGPRISPRDKPILAKLTGAADDPGEYDARVRRADGSYPDADDALVKDVTEYLDGSGWSLELGREVICVDTGAVTDDTPPRRILSCQGGRAKATPVTDLPAGTGTTLELTEWDRNGPAAAATGDAGAVITGPVRVLCWGRVVFDATTDPSNPQWRNVVRQPSYDATGNLFHVGPETWLDEIPTTTGCPPPP